MKDCGIDKHITYHCSRHTAATTLLTLGADILLKDVTSDVVSGLYDYMHNDYRNPGQIKVREGRLAEYSLLHFGQTVNAIFNKAFREGRIGFNPLRGLNNLERFRAPDKHREYLTPDELKRFLTVETVTGRQNIKFR